MNRKLTSNKLPKTNCFDTEKSKQIHSCYIGTPSNRWSCHWLLFGINWSNYGPCLEAKYLMFSCSFIIITTESCWMLETFTILIGKHCRVNVFNYFWLFIPQLGIQLWLFFSERRLGLIDSFFPEKKLIFNEQIYNFDLNWYWIFNIFI